MTGDSRTSKAAWSSYPLATHILAFEGERRVDCFEGNYQEYEANRRRRLGADANPPHRIQYKQRTG